MQTKFHAVLFGTGLSFALGLLACGSTKMTKTGEAQPPREKGCDFEIFTATPATGYTEIGAIDVNWGAYGTNAYRDIESFKKRSSLMCARRAETQRSPMRTVTGTTSRPRS